MNKNDQQFMAQTIIIYISHIYQANSSKNVPYPPRAEVSKKQVPPKKYPDNEYRLNNGYRLNNHNKPPSPLSHICAERKPAEVLVSPEGTITNVGT